jgi:exopolysaccharide biosynthesis polyprenyl glycosylphosphotransferase
VTPEAWYGARPQPILRIVDHVRDSSFAARELGDALRPDHSTGASAPRRGRGWLVRRVLLVADLFGLVSAFVITQIFLGGVLHHVRQDVLELFVLFIISLPAWVVVAKLYGLYERDEERTDHATTDDVVGVFHLVTVGVWVLYAGAWLTGITTPQLGKTALFWALAILFVTGGRSIGRSLARRSPLYVQNAVVVGAGDVGQLVALKYLHHPEYGIRLVGLVDDEPEERREELQQVDVLSTDRFLELVREGRIERVVVAFAPEPAVELLALVRELRKSGVQIDIVPRLFQVVPPNVDVHSVEGIALLGLKPARMSRSSRLVKRSIDVLGSGLLLILTAPLSAVIAVRIKLDSSGPVLFRQTRLGEDMREFTALKFRTMTDRNHDAEHRKYVRSSMSTVAHAHKSGLYKPAPDVTKVGRWLRSTSLDELPQLINVLKGDMSLVGPRPCIPSELEFFEPHHFERFLVPAGITGLWQVRARSRSTFVEALEMDVAYARGWSLALDLRLLCRTPLQVIRRRGAI